ncbi:hypothetical protein [Synechococcus sp. PCC 7336]|uniref:hypothetical protein n=1 Tax=Synechococcus sp. PCC 7336 TaxID=195250 RepID=UPI00034C7FAB|nr:hypothetical protein [Synechococcus sp. PCC 7336]
MVAILTVLLAIAAIALAFEWLYRRREPDALEIEPEGWTCDRANPDRYLLAGKMVAYNRNPVYEVTLADIEPNLVLLGSGSTESIQSHLKLVNPEFPRSDNYWSATLVGPKTKLAIAFEIELAGEAIDRLQVAWLQLKFVQYGRQQRIFKTGHAIVPLSAPQPSSESDWQQRDGALVLPVRTHLLNSQDTLPAVFERYAKPFAKPTDYLVLAETATAIVEGNYRYPGNIQPGWLAWRLCFFFPSKTSLCSAYGMQTLIDSSNAWQVAIAFILGAAAKVLGKSGVFYALAGYQAALIDDVTGTIPPYDQFLVLGPAHPDRTVAEVKAQTGMETAIVDANDLKEVKILAATDGIVPARLIRALRENPAGNADEQTPLLLVRPQSDNI